MRPQSWVDPRVLPLFLALGSVLPGCRSAPAPEPPVQRPAPGEIRLGTGRAAEFSSDNAWRHLTTLAEMGPRSVGSPGHEKAVEYVTGELQKLGLDVSVVPVDVTLTVAPVESDLEEPGSAEPVQVDLGGSVANLYATIPGTHSQDEIVLSARLDTRHFDDFEFIGANEGASGIAVVLELARVLVADPLPYATTIALLDGEGPFPVPGHEHAVTQGMGLHGLATRLHEAGSSGRRLVVYFDRVGDADLRIARDLMSDRLYRQEFWKSARKMGLTEVFVPDAEFDAGGPRHAALRSIGLRRIVSIVDTSFGGDEPPGLYAGTEQDTPQRCSAESLGAVGAVTLDALGAISNRLVKIDQFAESPTASPGEDQQAVGNPQEASP